MDYVNLGKSGLRVSRVCLGTMSFGEGDATRPWVVSNDLADDIFRTAVEAGIIFIDTADIYANGLSEEVTGRLAKKYFARDELVLATKVFLPMTPGPNGGGLSAKHIHAAIDASLKRLDVEYVDLYQIHRYDVNVPIEETMGALNELVHAGKVRYIGASSMYAWQFAKAQQAAERAGGARFISMQNHYNAVYREEEREMIPLCLDQGIGVIPWSPLARGFLAGNRERGGERLTERANSDAFADLMYRDDDFDVVDQVKAVAAARGVSAAQVALAWLLSKPGVTAPIIGATKVMHVTDAVAAEGLALSAEEIAQIEAPYQPHGILGH
jgi:aryl-alcohol dehydrogenase-like predicted oxidoreductase